MVARSAPLGPELPPAVEGPAFLQDGTQVWIRPPQPADRDLVRDFADREGMETLDERYFSTMRAAVATAQVGPPPSPADRLCLLVLGDRGDRVTVLGVGEYVRERPGSEVAEFALLVAGSFRGHGVATLLLARLARAARGCGILSFDARVPIENHEMLQVLRGSGLPYSERPAESDVHFLIPLSPELRARRTPPDPDPAEGCRPGARRPRRFAASSSA